jgi:hypothetical protein
MNKQSINSIVEKYTDKDLIYELAFTTHVKQLCFNNYLNNWKSCGFKLPFVLIKDLMINKGYIIDIEVDGYREDMYANWKTIYIMKITRKFIH